MAASESAGAWDELKGLIRQRCLLARRERLRATTLAYRRRMRRLHRAWRRAKAAAGAPSALANTETVVVGGHVSPVEAEYDKAVAIRREMIAVKVAGAARRSTIRSTSYMGPSHLTAHAFYKRISMKFAHRRTASLPVITGSMVSDADQLAAAWQPIVQREPCDADAQDHLFGQLPQRHHLQDFSCMLELLSAAEVAAAIKSCPRGKAAGPDGMPNDWYRDHSEELSSVLAPVFTHWFTHGVLHPSFAAATVYCIPKKAQLQTGLDYRPIALLNSDYKIYAKVLLNRIKPHVVSLVATTQFGFVGGRHGHDAVDVWSAVKLRVEQGLLPPSTAAVFLDFAKAYDTLDRRFLHLALQRHGFPLRVIEAVDSMHLATTAAYLADGQLSATVDVTTGIRQGCPLAPTLFVLAVDVLYEMVATSADIRGVQLADDVATTLVGFADDITAYVTSRGECEALLEVLARFEEAAGLSINLSKSKLVRLSPLATSSLADWGFPTATADELFRYLGVMVSTVRDDSQVWAVALEQLVTRLYLAAIETTDVLQRIQITRAILIPKIMYVARHCWPRREHIDRIDQFIHDYVWHGALSHTQVEG